MNGLPVSGLSLSPGRSDSPVKPTSEVAHQPGQQPAAARRCPSCNSRQKSMHPAMQADGGEVLYICPDSWHDGDPVTERARALWPWLCGGVQRGEIKSAGQTTGGARGGTRLGNPCDEDGLTR